MDQLHVLIVEDDKDTANFFSMVLGLVGFDCEIVHSAKQAFSHLAASQPDMILLDLRLGLELGGEDILYQIRSNPRLDQTRVIIITAYPAMAEPVTNLADLILLKPVEVEQLKTLASRLMLHGDPPKHYYFRDPVTDLFNRDFFLTRLELAFERSRRRSDFLFALVAFTAKLHPVSKGAVQEEDFNLVMREAASRLRVCFRPTDTIARMEGSQFLTLHEELTRSTDLDVIIHRMQDCLTSPIQIGNCTYQLSLAIGAALSGKKYLQPDDILEAAIHAMERARQEGEDGFQIAV